VGHPAGAQLNQPNKGYIYSGSQLLATSDASTGLSYQYPDHLSTRVEADANGVITRTFGHFPFGDVWYETGTATKWKFTTYERDSESQLDYAQFRFDSSRLGRFMSQDLLGGDLDNPESLDLYTYVLNDPSNLTDSAGLTPIIACLANDVGDCVPGIYLTFNFGGDVGNINACTGNGFANYFCAATDGGTQELFSYIEKYGVEDPIKGKRGMDVISAMYDQYWKSTGIPLFESSWFYSDFRGLTFPAFLGPIYDRKKVSVPKRHPPAPPR